MPAVHPLRAVWLLIARPRRFVELATRHDIDQEFQSNSQLLAAYPSRELPPDRVKTFEDNAADRTRKIRGTFGSALWSTGTAVLLGYLVGWGVAASWGKPATWVISVLAVAGAAVILVATLALLGWEIQSYKGVSLPEKVNRWLFRSQYWFGTFLFVLSLSWSA
jgi:hypothetical protein